MKIALIYDRVNKWGGAERVLLAMHELFPEAPLYTSLYHHKKASWAKVFPKVIPSFLNNFSILRDKHELIPYLMPLAFESFDFNEYDLVISVTSEAAKGIQTKGKTKHICYCLTPPRYLWNMNELYFKGSTVKGVVKPIISYLKRWDKMAASRPDIFVAISKNTQARIRKYYKKGSKIIYPPIDLTNFQNNTIKPNSKSFLIVSRLVKYKMVELAIDTFNEIALPLTIVGKGSEETKLRRKAKNNIKFLGLISDKKLKEEYQKAKALILPQEEDFGLVAIEAQAMGLPVIAYKKGGALETVIEGKTGIFFKEQTKESLKDAIQKLNRWKFDRKTLVNNAKRFSKENFKKEFVKIIAELL